MTFRIIYRSSSGLRGWLECANDQALLCGRDQLGRQGSHVVDLRYAVNVRTEPPNQAEVAVGDAHDRAQDTGVGAVVQLQRNPEELR